MEKAITIRNTEITFSVGTLAAAAEHGLGSGDIASGCGEQPVSSASLPATS